MQHQTDAVEKMLNHPGFRRHLAERLVQQGFQFEVEAISPTALLARHMTFLEDMRRCLATA